MQNQELRREEFRSKGGLLEYKAKKMASSLQYQKTILSRPSGDLYRIASIVVDDSFTDDAIVNPLAPISSGKLYLLKSIIFCQLLNRLDRFISSTLTYFLCTL